MRVLGISGSLRRDSHNTRLLRAAAAALPPGVELVELDTALIARLPAYSEDAEGRATDLAVHELRATIAGADAVLFATPEYNGSVPGGLKNAVDWASRPRGEAALQNLPAAVVGASPGMFGAVWAQADLRRVLGIAGARVVDRELPVAEADEAFTAAGRLADPEREEQLRELLAELAALVEARAAA